MHGIEDIYELSPMQSGMLFHSVYEAGPRMYFEQVVIPFDATVDPDHFAGAWAAVTAANPALRTSIHWEDLDKPVQVVHRNARMAVETWDLRREPPGRREVTLQLKLAEDRDRGFKLDQAPLMRVTLARMGPSAYRMVISFHHIILDGWSLQAVFAQFTDAYARLAGGGRPNLQQTRPYRAFIEWLQAQDPKSAEGYWAKVMADAPGPTGIGRATVGAQSNRPDDFGEVELHLSAEEADAARAASVAHQLTLNTLLQGAWAITLGRFTDQDDLVFGVTVSGRPAEIGGVEDMIGLFINTVPLRTRLSFGTTLSDCLAQLQSDQLRARNFDHCGLVQIREWAGLPGDELLFDTIFAFENYPTQRKDGDASADTTFIERTNYPLSVAVIPGDGLQVRLLYDGQAIEPAKVRAIGATLLSVLRSMTRTLATDPRAKLEQVVLDACPAHQTATEVTPYPEASLPDLFDQIATATPDAIAVESGDSHLTYGALSTRANELAARLKATGIQRGHRVALLLQSTDDLITAMLAVLKCGAAYIPLDLAYPPDRIASILVETNTPLILTDADHLKDARAHGTNVLDVAEADASPQVSGIESHPTPDDVAYVMFTSGSTGTPKGIEIPHRAIVRLVRNTDYVDLTAQDRIARHSNIAFDAATFEIWGALLNGGTTVALDRDTVLSPDALAHALDAKRITTMFLTTALFNRIAAERTDAFQSLDTLMFGGEAADLQAVRAVLDGRGPKRLLHVYGPTESTTFATWQHLTTIEPDQIAPPIGHAIGHTSAYVLDRQLRPVPQGAPGELFLGGDGLAHGYAGRAALTAQSFLPDPYSDTPGARLYRTGDRVRQDAEGRIVFLERIDTQIKLRGYRIELSEIEALLLAEPSVAQAVVVCKGEGEARRILAYVVPASDAPDDLSNKLTSALAKTMPSYALPETIVHLDTLPLNRNGKIDRAALPEPRTKPTSRTAAQDTPKGSTEEKLAQIWAAVLERDDFERTDNFFDIGGHSLRVTQLASRIKRDLGVDLALRTVFENPTVEGLARIIDADDTADAQAQSPDPTEAPSTPSRQGGIKPISRTARQRKRTTGA
ncbi:amino acid adenylation domain-containing protein [uncultured Tateyamaria sp.]|uniref:amino acid adenylation domain-containing protein n=1 Tax=uncultured Tateyamaria sp. TaxID=455651 RepID=UPI00262824B3|nr:amino acid adenylation domain-containing protein [uncultured Tateyamaria sp.]